MLTPVSHLQAPEVGQCQQRVQLHPAAAPQPSLVHAQRQRVKLRAGSQGVQVVRLQAVRQASSKGARGTALSK
jgi:hypothetical protein